MLLIILYIDTGWREGVAGFLQVKNGVIAGIVAKVKDSVRNYVNAMQDLMQNDSPVPVLLIRNNNTCRCIGGRRWYIYFVAEEIKQPVILSGSCWKAVNNHVNILLKAGWNGVEAFFKAGFYYILWCSPSVDNIRKGRNTAAGERFLA